MRKLSLVVAVVVLITGVAHAATYTVTSNADTGAGTLRQAILDANASGVPSDIHFAIGSGAQTIVIRSSLPATTVPININGTTQPGYAGAPLVMIHGLSTCCDASTLFAGNHLLRISAGGTVQALRFRGESYNFTRPDHGVVVDTAAATVKTSEFVTELVNGVHLHTGSTGSIVELNTFNTPNGVLVEVAGITIRQNTFNNTRSVMATTNGSQITGNTSYGYSAYKVIGDNNVIGGASPNGNTIRSGCPCGFSQCDRPVVDVQGNGNTIAGNLFLPHDQQQNLSDTTAIAVNGNNNQIGIAGAGNTVSGHGGMWGRLGGVEILGTGNTVAANTITRSRGHECYGGVSIALYVSGAGSVIGGTDPQLRNYLYDNSGPAIKLGDGVTVAGNSIGVTPALTGAAPNSVGIVVAGPNNVIGGTTTSARNIIAGHPNWDLYLGPTATNTTVQGNYLGTLNGTTVLGTGLTWVHQANNNVIGGTAPGAGNAIPGEVRIDEGDSNGIRRNRLCGFISLVNGGNRNQPAPALSSVTAGNPGTVSGTLTAAPNSSYTIEIFSNCDYVGDIVATTNASGQATFSGSPGTIGSGASVFATATSSLNDTSQKSNTVTAAAAGGAFDVSPSAYVVRTTDEIVTVTVTRTGDTSNTASVNYATYDGTARGQSDYTSASNTLYFAAGETSKTVTLYLIDDRIPESREQFTFQLSLPMGGTLGGNPTGTITIIDDDPFPTTFHDGLVATADGDFNGDGKSDVLWRNEITGQHVIWYMNGTSVANGSAYISVSPSFRVAGVADFNHDGKSDIVWYDGASGVTDIALMDGSTRIGGQAYVAMQLPWELAGIGDFNADGDPDILWRHLQNGNNLIWYLDGTNVAGGSAYFVVDPSFWLQNIDDFNNDGYSDLVWQNHAGVINVRLMQGSAVIDDRAYGFGGGWFAVAAGDFNGDATPDILLRNLNPGDGRNLIWYMNAGVVVSGSAYFVVDPSFRLELLGDFNGDYKADLGWRRATGGYPTIEFRLMNGHTMLGNAAYDSFDGNWRGVAPR
jgi:hypothetical protein